MSAIGRRVASCAISRLLFIWVVLMLDGTPGSVGYGRRAALRDELVLVEARETERMDEVGRPPRADQVGEGEPDDGRGLEAVRAPACVDDEAVDLGQAHDRRVVRRDIAEPRPLAQDLRMAQ